MKKSNNLDAKKEIKNFIKYSICFFFCELFIATYYFAEKFHFSKELGGLNFLGYHIYSPFSYIGWYFRFKEIVPKSLEKINSFLEFSFFGFLMIYLFILKSKNANNVHGSARWSTQSEISAMNLYNEYGAVLGCDPRGKILKDNGDKHIFMAAPTRGGKGINSVTPTAFDWQKSLVVNDIKGELWGLTSRYRKEVLGQKIFMFCPIDTTGTSCCFNPLDFISIGTGSEFEDVSVVSQTLIDTEGKGESDHWITSAINLLNATILHVKYAIPNASLVDVIEFITPPTGSFSDQLADILGIAREDEDGEMGVALRSGAVPKKIMDEAGVETEEIIWTNQKGEERYSTFGHAAFDHLANFENKNLFKEIYNYEGTERDVDCKLHPLVAREFMSLYSTPDKERGSIISTATQKLKLFMDPVIAKHIKHSDFTVEELMKDRCTLYLVTPPKSISRTRPLLRLIFTEIVFQLTNRMTFDIKEKKNENIFEKIMKNMIINPYNKVLDYFYPKQVPEKNRILLLIDEFPSLQKLDIIEQSMSYIAGYGLKCFLIAQSLKQFKKIYGKDNYILDNCSIQIFLTPNDEETPKMISDMFDTYTEEVVSKSKKGFDFMPTYSTSYVARKLMTAGEVRTLPYKDILLMLTGEKPIRGKKLFYYLDKRYKNKLMPCLEESDKKSEIEFVDKKILDSIAAPKEYFDTTSEISKTSENILINLNEESEKRLELLSKKLDQIKKLNTFEYINKMDEVYNSLIEVVEENKDKIEEVKKYKFYGEALENIDKNKISEEEKKEMKSIRNNFLKTFNIKLDGSESFLDVID